MNDFRKGFLMFFKTPCFIGFCQWYVAFHAAREFIGWAWSPSPIATPLFLFVCGCLASAVAALIPD